MTARELGMVLLSAALHAGWNVVAKRNDQPTAFLYLLTAVTLLLTLLLAPFLPFAAFFGALLPIVCISCVFHGASFIVLSRAYEAGDLSVVYPIARSTPAIVPLLAIPLLHEHVNTAGAIGIAITLAGMWLVQTGGAVRWHALREPAALWAYLMLLVTAGFSLIDKYAMAQLSHLPWSSPLPRAFVYYLIQTSGAALVALPFALRRIGARSLVRSFGRGWLAVSLAALATLVSYVLVLEALRTAQLCYVVAVRQCSVLFAVAFAVSVLAERPNRIRLSGTLGTVAGVVLIAVFA